MRTRPALVFCLAALPAFAQTPDEAAILGRLIDSACLDIHDEIGCETVALLKSATESDRADLLILTDRRAAGGAMPLLLARGFAFDGAMWGMSPSIGQTAAGSLQITSEQTGIGRNAWTLTLTAAWRDGAFVLAGITYATWDRITTDTASCDVNLRTGDYALEWQRDDPPDAGRETGRTQPVRIALADWTTDSPLPEVCVKALDRP